LRVDHGVRSIACPIHIPIEIRPSPWLLVRAGGDLVNLARTETMVVPARQQSGAGR
jgi:hypothetical protein